MKRTSITSGQTNQIRRLLEDVMNHAVDLVLGKVIPDLDQEGAQRILERGGDLKEAMAEFYVATTRELSLSNRFADEEVKSSYGYLSGYVGGPTIEQNLADLEKEFAVLRELFPELANSDYDRAMVDRIGRREITLPTGAERWTLIPSWEKVAATYGGAVQKVLDLIKQARGGKFYNYREGQLGPPYLRQHARTVEKFRILAEQQQGHDMHVVAAQFGIRHRGRSTRRAWEVMTGNEFGLGAYHNGINLLTHPERLQHLNDLWIDCAGDDYAPDGDGGFCGAPYFYFDDGHVRFDAERVSYAYGLSGSSSAFLSQN